jgi:hypothetical protein
MNALTGNVYITPHRQPRRSPSPGPPPVPPRLRRSPRIEERRWADYDDDEPLPTFVFGKIMAPIEDSAAEWTVVTRSNKKGNWRRDN